VFCFVILVNVLCLVLHMYCNLLPTEWDNNTESIAAISLALRGGANDPVYRGGQLFHSKRN
jgi:hypothetical protein